MVILRKQHWVTICHALHHALEPLGILPVLFLRIVRDTFFRLGITMYLTQDTNIFELVTHGHAHPTKILRSPSTIGRTLCVPWLVLSLPCIFPELVHGIVTERIRLFEITRHNDILTAQRCHNPPTSDSHLLAQFLHVAEQCIPDLEFDLAKHLPPDHTHLIHNEKLRLVHTRLHFSEPSITPILPWANVSHCNTEGTVQRRSAELQLKRRTASRRRQQAYVTYLRLHFSHGDRNGSLHGIVNRSFPLRLLALLRCSIVPGRNLLRLFVRHTQQICEIRNPLVDTRSASTTTTLLGSFSSHARAQARTLQDRP